MTGRLIGISGRARHGKNAVGEVLVRNGFMQVGFADALKEMALRLDPIVFTTAETFELSGLDGRLATMVKDIGWEKAKEFPEVRRILQVLGTECVRDILGEDSWIIALQKRIATMPGRSIAITDVRFPNEAAAIQAWGGELWHVRRFVDRVLFDNGLDLSHPSEVLVDSLEVDVEITNDGTLEDLERKVEEILYPPLLSVDAGKTWNTVKVVSGMEEILYPPIVTLENVPNYDSIPIVISPAGFIHPLATQCEWFGCKPTGGSSGPWTERELILVDVKAHPEERVPAPEDELPLDESC